MRVEKKYLLKTQYENAKNLETRISIHQYGTNPESFWKWVATHYSFQSGNSILEVGAGTGSFWKEIAEILPSDISVTLTDFSKGMLKTAEKNLLGFQNFTFEVVDVEQLPYPNDSFDIVLAHFMLYHASSVSKAIAEIKRVLKPSGWIGIVLPGKENMNTLFTLLDCSNPIQAKNFSAEHALEVFPDYFSCIEKDCYENKLIISCVEPILNYLKSLSKMEQKDETFYQSAQHTLEDHINRNKFLTLENKQWVFVLRK